ncbi:MAG: phosphoribosylanthranilate isomerase [Kiritimatiellae bacterium]|nr:phosphoribosylanthranilate isomerase [Kiritimatiellia bacterium]
MFVKICGIANREDAIAVARLAPDALGFIFWPDSPRGVTADQVAAWTPLLPSSIHKVGVFVSPTPAEVTRTVHRAGLDVVQLHQVSSVDAFRVAGCAIWEVIHADRFDWTRIGRARVDAYVADTYSKEAPGGTGKVGNWEAIRTVAHRQKIPVIMAGGLNRDNIREAIRAVQPWGVDVSSGVEVSPGRKDLRAVEELIRSCRNQ